MGTSRSASASQVSPLWDKGTCAAWRDRLEQYEGLLLAHEVNGLPELDAWYANELPKTLAARRPPYMTRAELMDVTRWKMKRGIWREYNRVRIANIAEATIRDVTGRALAAAGALNPGVATASKEYKEPVKLLCELDGVGPATASAALAAVRPDLYPFFDEWIAGQVRELGKVSFTVGYYWKYAEALRGKAQALSKRCGAEWTAHAVGQALWVEAGGKLKR